MKPDAVAKFFIILAAARSSNELIHDILINIDFYSYCCYLFGLASRKQHWSRTETARQQPLKRAIKNKTTTLKMTQNCSEIASELHRCNVIITGPKKLFENGSGTYLIW